MEKIFNKQSIIIKYFRAFIIILALPIITISIYLFDIYKQTLLDNLTERMMESIERLTLSAENDLKSTTMAASTIANDNGLIALVTQWNRKSDPNMKFEISREIDSKLNNIFYFNSTSVVESVIFFMKGKGYYYYRNNPSVSDDEIRKKEWYRDTLNKEGTTLILDSLQSDIIDPIEKYQFSVSIKPDIPQLKNDVEVIYICFKANLFNSLDSSFKSGKTGDIMIVNKKGKVILSGNNQLIGNNIDKIGIPIKMLSNVKDSFITKANNKKVVVTINTIMYRGWKIINVEGYKEVTNDIESLYKKTIAVAVVFMLLFIVFSIAFFRDIIVPLRRLMIKMKRVEKGHFDTSIDISENYEVKVLGQTFNIMVHEINKLILARDLKEKERSKAEIEALQSQINPHFLSNTLNSIRFMAMIAKVDSIEKVTEAFIKLLSATFGKTGQFITVKEEINNLMNYTYIMKVRYGDKFDVEFEIDDNIKDNYILRLVLQPILENAILHGFRTTGEKLHIKITGSHVEDGIRFKIEDDGIGMSEEQVANLLLENYQNPKGFTGIGVFNVDKRIKLNHGRKYGLKIESKYEKYTIVSILLPEILDKHGGGDLNV